MKRGISGILAAITSGIPQAGHALVAAHLRVVTAIPRSRSRGCSSALARADEPRYVENSSYLAA
jgi:hypothetical protein